MTISLEAIAHLEHSREYMNLHQQFHQFNPLKVLRVDHYEIRHSNVLAWLLDPSENHQLNSFFISKILTRLATKTENEDKIEKLQFLHYSYTHWQDTQIAREKKTDNQKAIDIMITVPSKKMVIIIENKFYAQESEGQLEEYLNYAESLYPNYKVIPIFLTLAGEQPTNDKYFVLDYEDIYNIIETKIDLQKEAMLAEVVTFLNYYLDILREELVEDEQASQLALQIYEEHKAAIDLLYFSSNNNISKYRRYEELMNNFQNLDLPIRESIQKIYNEKKKTIDYIFQIGNNVLREAFITFAYEKKIPVHLYKTHEKTPNFLPVEWEIINQKLGAPEFNYWLNYGFIIWFSRKRDDYLKINIELGPLPYEIRVKLLDLLEGYEINFRPQAKEEGRKYTKIYTDKMFVKEWTSKDTVAKALNSLYEKASVQQLIEKVSNAIIEMPQNQKLQENNSHQHITG